MGVGFAKDGESQLKSNRALKNSSRNKFKQGQETYLKNRGRLVFKNISKEDLEKFKQKLKQENKIEIIKTTIIVVFVLTLLSFLCYLVLF